MVFLCLWLSVARAELVEEEAQLLWVVEGSAGEASFGWVTGAMGDIDGDGAMDVIVGSPFESNQTGQTHLLSGRSGEPIVSLREYGERLQGSAVAEAGDTNGDGLPELLTGAPGRDSGAAFLYEADGSRLRSFSGENTADNFGIAVSAAGDADGDGYGDVVVGADHSDASGTDSGRVYLFSGADGRLLRTLEAESEGDLLGSGVGDIGDLDGDGRGDIAVGAADAATGARGAVYVFSSADGERILGPLTGGRRGFDLGRYFVDGVGDLNGDGKDDLYAADFSDNSATGRAFVYSGADGAVLLDLSGDYQGEGLGCGRGAGDVDGDGVPDLAIGAWQSDDGAERAGQVLVYSGADGAVLQTFTSDLAGENFGFDAVGLGDTNGDGAVDILVGAATGDRVYLVSGPAAPSEDSGDTGEGPSDGKRCGVVEPAGGWGGVLAGLLALGRRRG